MFRVRPHRIVVASAAVVALALPAGASAAGRPNAGHQWSHAQRPHYVSGLVTAMNATMNAGAPVAPATLSLKTGATTTVTVTVSATTTVVRRYNGPSGLDELTVGDHLSAWGAMDSSVAGQFDATRVKDWSIQKAYTRAVGAIQTVNADGSFALTVVGDRTRHSAYRRGEVVQVSLSSTCTVMSGGSQVAASSVTWQPGAKVLVMGMYDRLSHTLKADRVRILAAKHRGNAGPKSATPEATPTATP